MVRRVASLGCTHSYRAHRFDILIDKGSNIKHMLLLLSLFGNSFTPCHHLAGFYRAASQIVGHVKS